MDNFALQISHRRIAALKEIETSRFFRTVYADLLDQPYGTTENWMRFVAGAGPERI